MWKCMGGRRLVLNRWEGERLNKRKEIPKYMHQKPSKEAIEAAQKAEESLVALSDEMGATATTVLMKAIAAFNIHISHFEKIYGTAIAMAVVMGEGDFYKEEIGAKLPKDAEDIRRSARAV